MSDTPSPPCPRCDHDSGHTHCCNSDGSHTFQCYGCGLIWRTEPNDDFYLGDDARLAACRGIHKPRKESDNDG